MKIEIDIGSEEASDIIKEHVLRYFPVATTDKEVRVSAPYGSFTVEISEKPEPADEISEKPEPADEIPDEQGAEE